MISHKYHGWCELIYEEIISELSEEDKERIIRNASQLTPEQIHEKFQTVMPDIYTFLKATTTARQKSKKWNKHKDKDFLYLFSLKCLLDGQDLMSLMMDMLIHGGYREVAAFYSVKAVELKAKTRKVNFDYFPYHKHVDDED